MIIKIKRGLIIESRNGSQLENQNPEMVIILDLGVWIWMAHLKTRRGSTIKVVLNIQSYCIHRGLFATATMTSMSSQAMMVNGLIHILTIPRSKA